MGDEAAQAASIVGELMQAWVGGVQQFYDAMQGNESFGADDAVRQTREFVDRVMPAAERGITLTLDLLRPWSAAFVERMPDA
ncbi:MAG: hypothetical protein QOJ00_785 [Actinomycetota bacterium]